MQKTTESFSQRESSWSLKKIQQPAINSPLMKTLAYYYYHYCDKKQTIYEAIFKASENNRKIKRQRNK